MSNDDINNAATNNNNNESSDHNLSPTEHNNNNNEESNETLVTVIRLRLWSNGFSIEDGQLRSYENSENDNLLASILRDEYPAELSVYGKNIEVSVENRMTEKYRPMKRNIEFEGTGHRLDTPTTSLEINNSEIAKVELTEHQSEELVEQRTAQEIYELAGIKFNANKAITSIQIRLTNGNRLMAHFNLSNTIEDIYAYVQHARPEYATEEFILMTTHPTEKLINKKLTLEKAGLRNVLLTQHIKDD